MSEVAIINLPSRFDYSYDRQFSREYALFLENENVQDVVLDFSKVEYLDSSALGMMVLLHKKMVQHSKHGKIKSASGAILNILRMAYMQNIFEFD